MQVRVVLSRRQNRNIRLDRIHQLPKMPKQRKGETMKPILCGRCNFEYDLSVNSECPECLKANKPFYRTKEVQDKGVMTIRLNEEERALLEDIKATLDITSDGAALKLAAFKGWGVLQRTFGRDFLKWLSDKDRQTRGFK